LNAMKLANIDAFASIHKDITDATRTGGAASLLTYLLLFTVFFAELVQYFTVTTKTLVTLDDNADQHIQINFDVVMHDIPCNFLKVRVHDVFGEEKLNDVSNDFTYRSIDHKGLYKGRPYRHEEVEALEKLDEKDDVPDELKSELDADWASSHDGFKHADFGEAVRFHEFTFVNFFAEWCVHCRQFAPEWKSIANTHSEMTPFATQDGTSTVKFMKMNCVDFLPTCKEQGIRQFPTLRLYKRDGTFVNFQGKRSSEAVVQFLEQQLASSHGMTVSHHSVFAEGCRVKGALKVPRIAGSFQLHVTEGNAEVNLNPALTNVSHTVNHLSFADPKGAAYSSWGKLKRIPAEVKRNIQPLDGQDFYTRHFHEAPQHYLKVISTRVFGSELYYQFTHSDRVASLDKTAVPQAKFAYDLEPMAVSVLAENKPWYAFATSILALVGAAYAVMTLFGNAMEEVAVVVEKRIMRNRGHLD